VEQERGFRGRLILVPATDGQRWHHLLTLAGNAQSHPAGDQHHKLRACLQQEGDERSSVDHVFEVVQQQQSAVCAEGGRHSLLELIAASFPQSQNASDCWDDELRSGDRGERNNDDATREIARDMTRRSQRQPGFSRSSRPGKRQETHRRIPQRTFQYRQFSDAPDKR
jgi:hypothetical protein